MGRGQGQASYAATVRGEERILDHVRAMGFKEAYTVGGYERALLLGKNSKDVDIAIVGHTLEELLEIARREGSAAPLEVAGQVIGVRLTAPWTPPGGIELALARTETHEGGGRHSFAITTDPGISIEEDLARRDFTCNAIAQNISTSRVIDPLDGRNDITRRILRTVSEKSFPEDPLRVLRGLVRCAVDGFTLEDKTRSQMQKWAADPVQYIRGAAMSLMKEHMPWATEDALSQALSDPEYVLPCSTKTFREMITGYRWYGDIPLSPERVYAEMQKLLAGDEAAEALRIARGVGVLTQVFPELEAAIGFDQQSRYHDLSVDEHSLLALEHACREGATLPVRWAALLHDSGKPASAWGWMQGEEEPYPMPAPAFAEAPLEDKLDGLDELHFYSSPDGSTASHQDIGAGYARDILNRLSADTETTSRVVNLIDEHMYADDADFLTLSESAKGRRARRFLARVGRDTAEDLMLLRRCDRAGKRDHLEAGWDEEINAFRDRVRVEVNAPIGVNDLALDGHALMSLGFKGPAIGEAKRALLEVVLEDPELNTPDELGRQAKALWEEKDG